MRYWYTRMYTYTHMCTHIYTHTCTHTHMHIHTHVYTHIYTHVYTHTHVLTSGLMTVASHQTFPAKLSICLTKSNLARQIFYNYQWKFYGVCKRKWMSGQLFSPYHINTDMCVMLLYYKYQLKERNIIIIVYSHYQTLLASYYGWDTVSIMWSP